MSSCASKNTWRLAFRWDSRAFTGYWQAADAGRAEGTFPPKADTRGEPRRGQGLQPCPPKLSEGQAGGLITRSEEQKATTGGHQARGELAWWRQPQSHTVLVWEKRSGPQGARRLRAAMQGNIFTYED